ncbi:major facilitator superfamily [Apiospora arundinis]
MANAFSLTGIERGRWSTVNGDQTDEDRMWRGRTWTGIERGQVYIVAEEKPRQLVWDFEESLEAAADRLGGCLGSEA